MSSVAEFSPSCFLIVVLLTGGVVGVAGQFRGWQFAAYAVYPLHVEFSLSEQLLSIYILFQCFYLQ